MSRFVFGGKRRMARQLEMAEASFGAAVKELQRALLLADELQAPEKATQSEEARLDGWLAAISAVSSTALLNGHEDARRALVEELERGLNAFCDAAKTEIR